MNAEYECDGVGACCRSKLVDVIEEDIPREPRVGEQMTPLREPGLDGEIGYLNWGSGGATTFIDSENRCRIYSIRPIVCVLFRAGSDTCRKVRQAAGLPLLKPKSIPQS